MNGDRWLLHVRLLMRMQRRLAAAMITDGRATAIATAIANHNMMAGAVVGAAAAVRSMRHRCMMMRAR